MVPLVVRRDPQGEEAHAGAAPGRGNMSLTGRASDELSGVFATSPDALRRRLLGPWSVGLRQYLALRLGDVDLAVDAFRELRRLVASLPGTELLREPGPKAHVYRIARRIAAEHQGRRRTDAGIAELAFRDPPEATQDYTEALRRVRRAMPDEEAELVELRHARELSPVEIACVLELPISEVELRLDLAMAHARALLGPHAPDPLATRGGPMVDVFALAKGVDPAGGRGAESDALQAFAAGTHVGGRYRVVERVGVGAFGDVYRADDADVPGHRVALKILREPSLSTAARDAALRELKLIAAVFHPSVVQFKDHGWHEDRLWFVMPWYEGETLERRMKRGALTRAEARRIFEPLARALATLHANGIRHQDIKPDNVLLARIKGLGTDDGAQTGIIPVLLDLGVAAKEHEALIGGTPVYFAPEVASHYANLDDDRPIGPKADVFALALSLRNALEPWSEEDVAAGAIEAFVERRSRERPALPHARDLRFLGPHFERWLALDPDRRPTAEELADELAVLTQPEERRARRRTLAQWLVPAAVGLATVFAAVVYVFVRETELQATEIHRVRMEAAAARADLVVEAARLQALDADHNALIDRYEESRLTREQLADQLATVVGQVEILGGQIASLIADRDGLRASLDQTRVELGLSQEGSANTRRLLEVESQRARDLGRYVSELRADAERITSELEEDLERARGQTAQAEEDLDAARSARREAVARAEAYEEQLRDVSQERDRAVDDLTALRRRVAQLVQQLEPPPSPRRPAGEEAASPARGEADPL